MEEDHLLEYHLDQLARLGSADHAEETDDGSLIGADMHLAHSLIEY